MTKHAGRYVRRPKNIRQSTMDDALPRLDNFNQEITSLIGLEK